VAHQGDATRQAARDGITAGYQLSMATTLLVIPAPRHLNGKNKRVVSKMDGLGDM
jgi:hypothetical protein